MADIVDYIFDLYYHIIDWEVIDSTKNKINVNMKLCISIQFNWAYSNIKEHEVLFTILILIITTQFTIVIILLF